MCDLVVYMLCATYLLRAMINISKLRQKKMHIEDIPRYDLLLPLGIRTLKCVHADVYITEYCTE